MHDIVIRGGTIIDGTGTAGVTGDVAIDGGKLAQVGGKAGPGKREIKADGQLVTPGWVDVHTHYDGQATWDPVLAPSSWHGVTTLMFGNCGVGFAPARPEHREALIDLMEGVEDIPGFALTEGLSWEWESFPDFMNHLDRMPRTIDIAAQMPHHPLRVYVMGDRAIRREAATADDIAAMSKLTEEALRAGAFGFTTSRTDAHKTPQGDFVPGRYAEIDELLGIGRAFGAAKTGAFGMLSDFEDEAEEFRWITKQAKESGRPVWFLLTDRYSDPERYKRLLKGVAAARAQGAPVAAQVAGRPVGVILGVATSFNPFSIRPSWRPLDNLTVPERMKRLQDPALRAALLSEQPTAEVVARMNPFHQIVASRWDRMYVMGTPPDYEPPPEKSVASIASRSNHTPDEVAYDYLTESPDNFLFLPVSGYVTGDHEPIRNMVQDPGTILGLSDGGAHCGQIMDASLPSYMLTHWTRDRSRGPKLSVERVVQLQTSGTADFFGFHDRGRLAVGRRADVNVIDYDNLRLPSPEIAYDLPAGGRRLIQKVDGYTATLVAGQPVFENGQSTGALPGKLVRSNRK